MANQIPSLTLRKFSRLMVVSWVAVWLTVFPLIHIHPEADHAHGGTHHQHGGVAHTVLSQDLPCEFVKDSHHHAARETHLVAFPAHAHGHAHALSHSEITFSALNHSSDGPLKKHHAESFGVVNQDASRSYSLAWGNMVPQKHYFSSKHFLKPYFSRPPPTLLI